MFESQIVGVFDVAIDIGGDEVYVQPLFKESPLPEFHMYQLIIYMYV